MRPRRVTAAEATGKQEGGTMAATTEKAPKGQLGDWLDPIPEAVSEAAEAYDKAHSKAQKVKGELNTAKETLIEKMIQTGCKRCPIRNGEKFLELQEREAVKYAKPKEKPGVSDGDSSGGNGDIVTMKRVRGGRMVTQRTPAKVSVVANDAGAAEPLSRLTAYGMTKAKIEAVKSAVGPTIGHLEKAMRENPWWHRDIKGFGEEWIGRLQDAHLRFRGDYPVPSEDETEPEGDEGTVLDPAVAGAE